MSLQLKRLVNLTNMARLLASFGLCCIFCVYGCYPRMTGEDKSLAALRRPRKCQATSEAIEGPYYLSGAPYRQVVCDSRYVRGGTNLTMGGRIVDADNCTKGLVADLDIWQANPLGDYAMEDYTCRARLITNTNGYYEFRTVIPGRYLQAMGFRPAHIHFKITPRDRQLYESLTTQLYFADDPYLGSNDSCAEDYCHSDDATLVVPLVNGGGYNRGGLIGQWNVALRRTH